MIHVVDHHGQRAGSTHVDPLVGPVVAHGLVQGRRGPVLGLVTGTTSTSGRENKFRFFNPRIVR